MGFSMGFNKLNKVMAGATAFATISCLMPESAQAIQLKFTGTPNSGDELNFILDTSITAKESTFEEAIQKVTYECTTDSDFCPEAVLGKELNFGSGDLKAEIFEDTVQYSTVLSKDYNVIKIVIRVNSSDFRLLNSLEPLIPFIENEDFEVAADVAEKGEEFEIGDDAFGNPFTVTQVSEPDATSSLLGAGAIGAVLLLKRIGRSEKLAKNRP